MFERPSSQENNKITREEVLSIFQTKGIEDMEAKEMLSKYVDEHMEETNKITEKKENYRARIICAIDNAKLFYEVGYKLEAYDDLLETLELAHQAGEDDLVGQINDLLDNM